MSLTGRSLACRFVAEAKEQRFQRRVARLKATSCLHTVQAELSRLRQALEDEHTKLAVTLSELTRLRKVMAAEAAQVSGWTPAAVQHHYSRVVEQQPVSVSESKGQGMAPRARVMWLSGMLKPQIGML